MADEPVLVHYLLVTAVDEGERDIEVIHDPGCPYEEESSFLEDAPPVRSYTCDVGRLVAYAALDDIARPLTVHDDERPEDREPLDLATLEPGSYEIAARDGTDDDLRFVHRSCAFPGCPEPVTQTLKGKVDDPRGEGLVPVVVGVCGHHNRQVIAGILDRVSLARDGTPVVSSTLADA